ncbi:MAG TPA: arylsulfatase [Longimicrobiaceae bacterium]
MARILWEKSFPRRLRFATALAGCAAAILLSACAGAAKPPGTADRSREAAGQRPNVVIILADDLGFSDIGSYGGEIRTPNLDRLAAEGLRFTQFYNTARCYPTRASLLTGLYPHQAGIGAGTFDRGLPGYRGHLTENTVTIAEVLRDAGYRTGMVGKWHVSNTLRRQNEEEQLAWLAHRADYGPFSPLEQYPVNRGFQDYYGNIWGVVDYFDPFSLVNGLEPVDSVPEGYYHTDAISDSAVAYVERYARDDAPFFLYVAYTAPHWPLHALPGDIARYENTYNIGWEAIREARYRRQVEMGLLSSETAPLSPRIDPELTWAENPHREFDARAMAVHAAMVDRMDQGIGRLIGALERTGELENTLIFFLSDNGASPERPSEFGPGFDRPGSTRDGRPVVFPVDKQVLPGPQTVHAGIGPRWANVANTPFRFWKARAHEGGIATPLIIRWPVEMQVPPSSITDQPGHVIDLMATVLDAAGVDYPATYQGRRITPLAGKSLLPILRGEEREGHDAYFWEHMGARAVRSGDWKLVSTGADQPWELYNLATDRTELHDLAEQHPERVRELEAKWTAWARSSQVLPRP